MTDKTTYSSSDSQTYLTTVRKRQVKYDDTAPFYGNYRNVDDFEKLNRVGEGTYGVVYRVKDTTSGKAVAIKRIRMEFETVGMPISSLHEISLLKCMQHPNIVNVSDMTVDLKLDSIFLVMEYCEQDLGALLDMMPTPYTASEVKCLMIQLLKGLEYCHHHSITHHNLKMSNLLLPSTGLLKIADFGLARTVSLPGGPMTPNVVTLRYRSPELLYGDADYTTAVDLWSAGCIMGELLQHRSLLPGTTEQSQLDLIVKLLGIPNKYIWPVFTQLALAKVLLLPKQDKNTLQLVFPRHSDQTIRLLAVLPTYNPRARLTVRQALQRPYFKESPRAQDPSMLSTCPEIRNVASEKEKTRRAHDEERKRNIIHVTGGPADDGNILARYKKQKAIG